MTIVEKAAYLKGLTEGLGITPETKEGKLWAALQDLLTDIAHEIEDMQSSQLDMADALDELTDELTLLQDSRSKPDMLPLDDEDEDDEDEDEDDASYDSVLYDVTCRSTVRTAARRWSSSSAETTRTTTAATSKRGKKKAAPREALRKEAPPSFSSRA